MENIESIPHPVQTSPIHMNFGEGAEDCEGLEEKTL